MNSGGWGCSFCSSLERVPPCIYTASKGNTTGTSVEIGLDHCDRPRPCGQWGVGVEYVIDKEGIGREWDSQCTFEPWTKRCEAFLMFSW